VYRKAPILMHVRHVMFKNLQLLNMFDKEAGSPPHFSFANPSLSINTFSRATVSCANFVYCAELM
jgi:hypothetical protein